MSWLPPIGLALAAFALAVFAYAIGRRLWSALGATLALGLAGYALQASPGLPGAPAEVAAPAERVDWVFVEARKEMVGEDDRSRSQRLIVADAFARQRQYEDAASFLRLALAENPRDGEAWLALANVLVEHADGTLTEPALLAFRRADARAPGAVGPGYFLGLALIRQGRLLEGRQVWQSALEAANADAAGREALETRLARLDALLANEGVVPLSDGR